MVKKIVIDCKGHLLGRLASFIAKELLNGSNIVALKCEQINISGSLYRKQLKYQKFLRLRMNSNPRKGPIHFRAPSKILWRTIRGMIPHKTSRGEAALKRLQVFEGVPSKFIKQKKNVISAALRVTRLKPGRKFCNLGDLSKKVGWNYGSLVEKLESKRKSDSSLYYKEKIANSQTLAKSKQEIFATLPQEWQEFLTSTKYA